MGVGQLNLGVLGSSQTMGDFFGAFVKGVCDRGPHEFHREPHQNRENDHLDEQGCIDAHGNTFLMDVAGLLQNEWVCERKHHGDTHANQESGVDQTSQQEHLGLQFVHQLWLTGSSFEVFATHDADTDTSTNSAQANDEAGGKCDITENVFHL
jgi:hypothetical protein